MRGEEKGRGRFRFFSNFAVKGKKKRSVAIVGARRCLSLFFFFLTCRPELTMRLTALPPPPPTPMTLMRASPPVVMGVERQRETRMRIWRRKKKNRKKMASSKQRASLALERFHDVPPPTALRRLPSALDVRAQIATHRKRRTREGSRPRREGPET